MTDLSAIIAFIPEPQRGYVLAALYAFLATQLVASGIVAVLPAEAFKWRPLRALSWYAHLAPRDAAGTFKAPFTAPLNPGAMADLAKLQAFAARVQRVAPELVAEITPPSPSKVTPVDHSGERGSVRVGTMLALCVAVLVASVTGAVLTGCPPTPPVDGGVAVTPSGWTSTARVVLDTLRWAVPAARAITDSVVPEPARTQVGRALDATGDAARELSAAVDAYEIRGGDRCAAHAAVGGLHRALVGLARVLADSGIALGTTLERVVDGVASIADALVPACDRDAGWASAGDRANAELRAISTGRGPLRRVLDDLRPMDAGAR